MSSKLPNFTHKKSRKRRNKKTEVSIGQHDIRKEKMRSISIEELRSEVEAYIEAAKSARGDSAVRYLNRAETALRSYDGVPERFKNTYFKLIEDIKNDLEQ